jgi:glycosyltransferase involved in cell wall biosynthesis
MHQYQPFERLNDSLNSCDASLVTIADGIEGISFPSKLYTSLAVGKPVLAISEPGGELEGMVRDTGAGLWSPVGDVDALVANIRRLMSDSETAARMGRRARSLMEEQYTIEAAARDYLRVIDRAAAERR